MMKEQQQIEELSKAIDALNGKIPFHTTDPEVKQAMDTAIFVKQYGCTAQETEMISQLAKQISADIAARRRRKRLVSAIAGIAAAAFVFAGISFQTPAEFAQEQSREKLQSPQVAVVDNSKLTTGDSAKLSEPPSANTSQPAANPVRDSRTNELPPRHTPTASTPEIRQQPAAKQQPVAKPQPAAQPQTVAEAPQAAATVLMILPGRSADTVMTEAGGTVRQIYGKNTDKEIIVTQRSGNKTADKAMADPGAQVPSAARKAETTTASLNQAIRKVDGMEVVVEGKQTQAELEKVADSLVPAAQADNRAKDNQSKDNQAKDNQSKDNQAKDNQARDNQTKDNQAKDNSEKN